MTLNRLQQFCIGELTERLEDYEGCYFDDMTQMIWELFEVEINSGSWLTSKEQSKNWIINYWDDIASALHSYNLDHPETPLNPFVNPEDFQTQIVVQVCIDLMYDNFNLDEFELTEEVINEINAVFKS